MGKYQKYGYLSESNFKTSMVFPLLIIIKLLCTSTDVDIINGIFRNRFSNKEF